MRSACNQTGQPIAGVNNRIPKNRTDWGSIVCCVSVRSRVCVCVSQYSGSSIILRRRRRRKKKKTRRSVGIQFNRRRGENVRMAVGYSYIFWLIGSLKLGNVWFLYSWFLVLVGLWITEQKPKNCLTWDVPSPLKIINILGCSLRAYLI